jgi:hypothetical protein
MSGKVQTLKLPVQVVAKGGTADEDDEDDGLQDAPLFGGVDGEKKIAHVLVIRQDPDEGTLGKMPPTVTELEIKRRWGGGTFQLQGKDERNRPMKGAFRTVTIAGDPIFESEAAQLKWKRQQGLADKPATAPADGFGIKEIFALLNSTEVRQKADADRRTAELEAQHKREIERIRVEGELRARERADEEERRERMAEEREERRRREDAEREDRRRKDDDERRARDKEFQLQLAQLGRKGSADGSEMLLRGIELARSLGAGGGEGDDPVTSVAKALLSGVMEKFQGGGGAKQPSPAAPGATGATSKDAVTLDGAIGTKANQVIAHLQREGYEPEAAISQMFDLLLKARRKTAPDPPPAAPAAPSSPAAAAAAVSNGTATVKRRTTKK